MITCNQGIEPSRLDREAHAWVTLLVSGEANVRDAEAVRQWREQSPAHEAAYAAAIGRWRDFGLVGPKVRARADLPVWTPPLISRRAVLGGAGALVASVVGYAFVRPPLELWPSLSELTADYRTATGEQRSIVLAGDISVRMNSQTSIAVPSSGGDGDHVRLIAGEAAFDRTSQRTLEVLAGDGRTIAHQARFDVRNVGSTVCVTCFDGDLRVEIAEQVATVGTNRQVSYDARGLQPAVAVDPGEAKAWQDGFLIFHLTPLTDVIAEINRYRPGKVILMNPSLGRNPVNGRFSIRRIDEVLTWIEYAFDAKPHALPGGILLLS
ncbi:MAG: FecR domain-containing protein [Ancalomicrobiaceae bacterium]|nr:FecR domain-containing protein [Ancalomicrobiaceae bacterium]